jgi:hypothetical protein
VLGYGVVAIMIQSKPKGCPCLVQTVEAAQRNAPMSMSVGIVWINLDGSIELSQRTIGISEF